MRRRGKNLLLLAALATLPAELAKAGNSTVERATNAPASVPVPVVRFRFNAGAPLVAPAAVGADGTVVVGGEDGYLHALDPDGRYRWSFTLRGGVAQSPLVTPELIFAASSADRIYALAPDGALVWVFVAPAGVQSELALAPNGLVYFLGRDRHLYGLTSHGSVALRVPVGEVSAGPVIATDGAVWLGSPRGELFQARLSGAVRVPLGGAVRSGVSGADASYWLAGQELVRIDPGGRLAYRVAGIARLAGPAGVTTEGDCIWLDGEGHTLARLASCATAGARPALGPRAELLLPADDGALVVATPAGTARLALASSRLLSPVWSPAARIAIVSAREGLVAGVELRAR